MKRSVAFRQEAGLLVAVGIPDVTNKSHFKGASLLDSVIMIPLSAKKVRSCGWRNKFRRRGPPTRHSCTSCWR